MKRAAETGSFSTSPLSPLELGETSFPEQGPLQGHQEINNFERFKLNKEQYFIFLFFFLLLFRFVFSFFNLYLSWQNVILSSLNA